MQININGVTHELDVAGHETLLAVLKQTATRWRVSGSASRPENSSAIHGGMVAPQLAENSIARVKLVIGRMPGTIGTSMPAMRARSTKRR